MTTSLANIALDAGRWIDLCAVQPAIADAHVVLRYLSPFAARIVHGGAGAPSDPDSGDALKPGEAVYANASHIWATGHGALSVTIL